MGKVSSGTLKVKRLLSHIIVVWGEQVNQRA